MAIIKKWHHMPYGSNTAFETRQKSLIICNGSFVNVSVRSPFILFFFISPLGLLESRYNSSKLIM